MEDLLINTIDWFTTLLFVFFFLTTINYLLFAFPNFFKAKKHFKRSKITTEELEKLILAKKSKYKFTIQFTTRGAEIGAINIGLRALDAAWDSLGPKISDLFEVIIVTDDKADEKMLSKIRLSYKPSMFVVPVTYQTANNTKFKARALHYMMEQRRKLLDTVNMKTRYVIYFDSESVLYANEIASIVASVYESQQSKKILQGPIFYPINWHKSRYLCKQMESIRPWNCFECYSSTSKGKPYHLHGSNVVIRTDIEQKVGWDFGTLYNYPLVAEDLLFGVKAFLLFGKQAFWWHGAAMYEQPAILLKDSINQRVRWVKGSLQAAKVVQRWPEFRKKSKQEKRNFLFRIYSKIFLYAVGFIPSLATILVLLFIPVFSIYQFFMMDNYDISSFNFDVYTQYTMAMVPLWLKYISLIGALLWILSIQIGLSYNLEKVEMSIPKRILEHLIIIIITPIATVFDTGTAFFTSLFWIFGYKKATWEITTKSSAGKETQTLN